VAKRPPSRRGEPSSARKIVLLSRSGYHPRHDGLLLHLLSRRILLFCAVGEQCEEWEEAMDELCVGSLGAPSWLVTTTSHPGEPMEEVLAFARLWVTDEPTDVEVIEV